MKMRYYIVVLYKTEKKQLRNFGWIYKEELSILLLKNFWLRKFCIPRERDVLERQLLLNTKELESFTKEINTLALEITVMINKMLKWYHRLEFWLITSKDIYSSNLLKTSFNVLLLNAVFFCVYLLALKVVFELRLGHFFISLFSDGNPLISLDRVLLITVVIFRAVKCLLFC